MDILERIEIIQKSKGLNREDMAIETGIKFSRLNNIFSGRAKIRHEEIEAIGKKYKEYGYWLAYGEEIPEAGQISPMTKATMEDYKKTGGD